MMKLDEQLYTLLCQSEGHMTADEMYLLCKQKGIKASVASVYRVLSKLTEEGRIRRIPVSGGADFFDKAIEEHEHLMCSRCGKVSDFVIPDLGAIIERETGVHPDSFDLCVRFICENCARAQEKTS